MTTEEALRLAKQYGWTVTKTPAAPAQRKTLVEGANNVQRTAPQRTAPQRTAPQRTAPQRTNPNIYRSGDYLREKLRDTAWHELADRSRPLPQGVSASHLVKEFSQLLAGIIEMNYN